MTTPRDDIAGLIERLKHLVSLNGGAAGGPYQGYAAKECVSAMSAAATQLAALSASVKELEQQTSDLETLKNLYRKDCKEAESRAARLQQERDDAYERAVEVALEYDKGDLPLTGICNAGKVIAAAIRQLAAGNEKEGK